MMPFIGQLNDYMYILFVLCVASIMVSLTVLACSIIIVGIKNYLKYFLKRNL